MNEKGKKILFKNNELQAFYLQLTNTSSSDATIKLFDITDTQQQQIIKYTFNMPLVASYGTTTARMVVDGITYNDTILVISTPDEFATFMTGMGHGTWYFTQGATSNIFYIYSNTIIYNSLRFIPIIGESVTITPTTVTTLGSSNVTIAGSTNMNNIFYSQVGNYYKIKHIWLYSASDSQLLTPILFNQLDITGAAKTKAITPVLGLDNPLPTAEIKLPDFRLNQISNIQFNLEANTGVQMKFYYSNVNLDNYFDKDNSSSPDIILIPADAKTRKWLLNKISDE